MGKSKKRGGEKEHRKRVESRNQMLKGMWEKLQKKAWEKFEESKKQKDANKDTDDQSISGFNITEQKG
jgi:hypothetical protein